MLDNHHLRTTSRPFEKSVPHKHKMGRREFGRKKPAVVVRETVVPEPDYRIPVILLGAAGALLATDNALPAAPIGLLGLLLLFQNGKQLYDVMVERCGPSQTSGPK
ncbi:hypothetical protein R1flu_020177 [Riccia fluitans]|uniref:Uncharacterized protein n=1 Tax=Riccia fluitans TaxID=41844 RepID=A0ABD1ZKS7_9MARC